MGELSHTVTKENTAATIIWFAITIGAAARLSHYKEKE
jgi:hypothetical protein